MEQRDRSKARHRALAELGKRYPDEYRSLYRAEIDKLTEAPDPLPEPEDGKAPCRCGHTRRFHGSKGCQVCPCAEFRLT